MSSSMLRAAAVPVAWPSIMKVQRMRMPPYATYVELGQGRRDQIGRFVSFGCEGAIADSEWRPAAVAVNEAFVVDRSIAHNPAGVVHVGRPPRESDGIFNRLRVRPDHVMFGVDEVGDHAAGRADIQPTRPMVVVLEFIATQSPAGPFATFGLGHVGIVLQKPDQSPGEAFVKLDNCILLGVTAIGIANIFAV